MSRCRASDPLQRLGRQKVKMCDVAAALPAPQSCRPAAQLKLFHLRRGVGEPESSCFVWWACCTDFNVLMCGKPGCSSQHPKLCMLKISLLVLCYVMGPWLREGSRALLQQHLHRWCWCWWAAAGGAGVPKGNCSTRPGEQQQQLTCDQEFRAHSSAQSRVILYFLCFYPSGSALLLWQSGITCGSSGYVVLVDWSTAALLPWPLQRKATLCP